MESGAQTSLTGFDEWDRAKMERGFDPLTQIEEPSPLYFDGALTYPPKTLYRYDGGDIRWYFSPQSDRFYASVTSIIHKTMPTPYGLIQWMIKNSDDHEDIRDERAAYGTWLHIQLGRFLIERTYSLDTLTTEVYAAAVSEGADPQVWYDSAKKDILAFAAFVQEHRVRPLAIELMLSSENGFAGSIDLVCEMSVGSGQNGKFLKRDGDGERITAIVDMKSGRKGFYENHEIQLHMYRQMWEENFPGIKISRLFNWSPKDWRTGPSFNLKDQTDSGSAAKIPHLLSLFDIDSKGGPGSRLVVRGTITPECDLGTCYAFEDIQAKMRSW